MRYIIFLIISCTLSGAADYTITVTATKKRENILSTPYSINTVSHKKAMEDIPTSVAEMIQETPGVSMLPKGLIMINPIIRGFGGRRILMLLDGSLINSNKTMGAVGHFINLYDIKQIEIIRGPGSVLYGSGALGGVINVVSKDNFKTPDGFSGHLGTAYGFNNQEITEYSLVNFRADNFYISLSGRYRDGDNYTAGGDHEVPASYYQDQNIFLRTGFRWEKQKISIDIRDYRGDHIGKAQDNLDISKLRKIYFPVEDNFRTAVQHQYTPQSLHFKKMANTFFYSKTDRTQRVDIFDSEFKDLTTYTQKKGDMWNIGGNGHILFNPTKSSTLIVGYDYIYKSLDSSKEVYLKDFINPDQFNQIESGKEFKNNHQLQMALFLQHDFTFSRFKLTTSLRGDLIKTEGDYQKNWDSSEQIWYTKEMTRRALSGNIGLLFNPTQKSAVKLNLSRSFRAPDLREMFFAGANCFGYTCGNPNLDPESGYNIDLSFLASLKSFEFELNTYLYFIQDFINFIPPQDGAEAPDICELYYQNTNNAQIMGFEGKIKHHLPLLGHKLKLTTQAIVGYIHGKDLDTDDPLGAMPPLKFDIKFRLHGKPFLNYLQSYFFTFKIHHEFEQNQVAIDESESESFTIFTLKSGITIPIDHFFKSAKIYTIVKNVTDKKYRSHLSTPYQIGRAIKINLQFIF